MPLEPIQNHEERAIARVAAQYRGQHPGLEDLLAPFARQVQLLEDAAHAVRASHYLDNAVGQQLDWAGRTVGEERQGRDDDTYRLHVRARLLLNLGSGTAPELLRLFRLLEPTARLVLDEQRPATVLLSVTGRAVDDALRATLLGFLRAGKAGGVAAVLHYSTGLDADSFAFASAEAGGGFGSVYDPAAGGKLSGITS